MNYELTCEKQLQGTKRGGGGAKGVNNEMLSTYRGETTWAKLFETLKRFFSDDSWMLQSAYSIEEGVAQNGGPGPEKTFLFQVSGHYY